MSTMDLFEILPKLRWVATMGVGKLRRFDMENNLDSGHLLHLDISANSVGVVGACGTALGPINNIPKVLFNEQCLHHIIPIHIILLIQLLKLILRDTCK
jgi:hypothetical protein